MRFATMHRVPSALYLCAMGAIALLGASGCDKLKAVAGGARDGGAGSPSAPSIVGDLFTTDFEGEITSKLTNAATPGKAQLITFEIKKPKYRMDMSEASPTAGSQGSQAAQGPQGSSGAMSGSVILDLPTKKGWLLIHPQKMAMPLDLTQPMAHPNIPGMPAGPKGVATQAPSTPPQIEKTGRKDTVAGYSCEIWNITANGRKSEVCMAENLTWIDISDMGFESPEIALTAATTGGNHFPLRVITRDATGKEETRMEAQKIEKKKLDDTRFVPPPDYRQFNPAQLPAFPQLPKR